MFQCPSDYPLLCDPATERARLGLGCVQQREHCSLTKTDVRDAPRGTLPRPPSKPQVILRTLTPRWKNGSMRWAEYNGDEQYMATGHLLVRGKDGERVHVGFHIDDLHRYLWDRHMDPEYNVVEDDVVRVRLSENQLDDIQKQWEANDSMVRSRGYDARNSEDVEGSISCINLDDDETFLLEPVKTLAHRSHALIRIWEHGHSLRCYSLPSLFQSIFEFGAKNTPNEHVLSAHEKTAIFNAWRKFAEAKMRPVILYLALPADKFANYIYRNQRSPLLGGDYSEAWETMKRSMIRVFAAFSMPTVYEERVETQVVSDPRRLSSVSTSDGRTKLQFMTVQVEAERLNLAPQTLGSRISNFVKNAVLPFPPEVFENKEVILRNADAWDIFFNAVNLVDELRLIHFFSTHTLRINALITNEEGNVAMLFRDLSRVRV